MSAVDIRPKFVPASALHARDNSGGPGFETEQSEFGDHSVRDPKAYLSAGGSKKESAKDD